MEKGIIYVMTTVVPGLLKLGKVETEGFYGLMAYLEDNGYLNVTGLKRLYALELEGYREKYKLLDDIFSKSKVEKHDLFALDEKIVVQLLSCFTGTCVPLYHQTNQRTTVNNYKRKKENNSIGPKITKRRWEAAHLPNGYYYLKQECRGFGTVEGTAIFEDGYFRVLKGSRCGPLKGKKPTQERLEAVIKDNILQKDVYCTSPSGAGWIIIGNSNNGWTVWCDEKGRTIDTYRKKE